MRRSLAKIVPQGAISAAAVEIEAAMAAAVVVVVEEAVVVNKLSI